METHQEPAKEVWYTFSVQGHEKQVLQILYSKYEVEEVTRLKSEMW